MIETPTVKLFFREFGSGEPLVILHGLFGLSDNWVSIGKLLGQYYRVIIPDLRNHGQSPHTGIFDYEAMTADVAALLDDLKLSSAIILGHSMGGKVAMQFALLFPERTKQLIVVDISLRRYDDQQQQLGIIKAMMSVDFDQLESRVAIGEHLRPLIPEEKVRLFVMKNLYRESRERLGWRPGLHEIFPNLDRIFEAIIPEAVYDGRTLFIGGAHSNYISSADKNEILNHFPSAAFVTVADAGHWVHADNPEGFLQAVSDFLNVDL